MKYHSTVNCGHYQLVVIIDAIIRLTHANVWKSMGKPCSCMQFIKSRIFYYKSRENPYQVLQGTQESVPGTASHVRASERAMK